MTVELYQVPTLILLAAAVAVFAGLWLQGRSLAVHEEPADGRPGARRRQLLWLSGWVLCVVHLAAETAGWEVPGWHLALSLCALELAPLMFLASLAPQYVIRKPPLPFVAAFGLPVVVYCTIVGVHPAPGPLGYLVLLACTVAAIALTVQWSLYEQLLPAWLSLSIVALVGGGAGWLTMHQQYSEVIALTHSGVLLMTALLFVSAFRRLSTGLVFTVGGLLVWALPALLRPALQVASLPAELDRANLVKVVAAIGMILLVLEEEIAANLAARQRDRRTRQEMEKYTALYVADIPFEDDGSAYEGVCQAIAEASRFAQAAIFLESPEGRFSLTARAGMDKALAVALDAMARRTSASKVREIAAGNGLTPVAGSLMRMDMNPLLEPGDDLEQMKFLECWVMAIRARDRQLHGVLMLSGLRDSSKPLTLEDVLPLELLISRIGAAREHAVLVRRLVQSERLAGLGQLAGGVAHELNNPLQAVTGFAELLADGEDPAANKHAAVILSEARRMKQIIDSLLRFRTASLMERLPVSVAHLAADIQNAMQPELESARVELQVNVREDLPRVGADEEQIRRAFLQVMKNAAGAFDGTAEDEIRRIRIGAEQHPRSIQIVISHNGRPFSEPARAFDPFFKARSAGEGTDRSWSQEDGSPGPGQGLDLSICYAIVREHGGGISAVNLHPTGAAVVIELPIYVDSRPEGSEPHERPVPERAELSNKGHASAR